MRCHFVNLNNEKYIDYHDNIWGRLNIDDQYLFKMLILESFQAGLSWECILNKMTAFELAYDNFNLLKVITYDEKKIDELMHNKDIVRNYKKIEASIINARIFKRIIDEFGSFYKYLCTFTNNEILYEYDLVSNDLSDAISKDLKKRGMKFVGTKIIYSYLQAIGIINSHEPQCMYYKKY